MAPPTSTSLIYLMEQTKASTTLYQKKPMLLNSLSFKTNVHNKHQSTLSYIKITILLFIKNKTLSHIKNTQYPPSNPIGSLLLRLCIHTDIHHSMHEQAYTSKKQNKNSYQFLIGILSNTTYKTRKPKKRNNLQTIGIPET